MAQHTVEEILSQPDIWQSVIEKNAGLSPATAELIKQAVAHRFAFVGSGTSYYLSLSAAAVWRAVTGLPAQAVPSAEIIFYADLYAGAGGAESVFLISRSGTTTEILRAGQTLEKFKTNRISLTCRENSDLSHMGEYRYLLENADEKSVVMTRSFTSMLLQIQILAAKFARNKKFQDQLVRLPELGHETLDRFDGFARDIILSNEFTKFMYLGHGPFFGLASEAMLKVKEMSVANSEAYHSLEYRHGPMSLVDEHTLIVFLLSDCTSNAEIKLIKEMNDLSAKSLVLCERASRDVKENAHFLVELNSGLEENARLVLYLPILQRLAYHNAYKKGLDPDEPNNLTQVVTLT